MQPELDERLLRDSRAARPEPDPKAMRRGIAELLLRGERAARRRRQPLVTAIALAAVLGLALVALASDRPNRSVSGTAPARVVDRTFACRTSSGMPTKVMSNPQKPAFVGGGPFVGQRTVPNPSWLAAGAGSVGGAWPFVVVRSAPFPLASQWGGPSAAGAFVDPTRCVATRTSVPLARTGLPGPAYDYDKSVNCVDTTRVYVRVRATLAVPARWRRLNADYTGAQGRVLEAALAVRDAHGRPLAFAGLRGRTVRAWFASRCY